MKFEVGDKVKAKGDKWFNKGETLEIVGASPWDKTYRCSNGENVWWQDDSTLESIDQSLTFQQKLDRFKREPIGFHVRTKEIADELTKVFTKEGLTGCTSESASEFMIEAWDTFGKGGELYVSYNYPGRYYSLAYGLSDSAGRDLKEILELTMEDFKDSQTVITITSDGIHRVTAETNGYSAEALCCPTDIFSLTKGSHMALQRLLEKVKESAVDEPEFCVGDIVEIMGTDTYFLKESIGLQGVILSVRVCGRERYLVKLPVDISGDTEWRYDDLKLIRRVNV